MLVGEELVLLSLLYLFYFCSVTSRKIINIYKEFIYRVHAHTQPCTPLIKDDEYSTSQVRTI